MKKTVLLLAAALLAVQIFLAVPVEGQEDITATDVQVGMSGYSVSVSWITNEKTTGWVRYGLDSSDNITNWANDTRDAGITLASERTDAYTHFCLIDLTYNQSQTAYIEIYGGADEELTSADHLEFSIPLIEDFPPSFPVAGNLSNGITGIHDAIIHMNVTSGSKTSTTMSTGAFSSGGFLLNAGNGIFWDDLSTYYPLAGDEINLKVDAGPLGTFETSHTVTTTDITSTLVVFEQIVMSVPFDLSSVSVSPDVGDSETEFTFSVTYTASDSTGPDSVILMLNDVEYEMTTEGTDFASGVEYNYTTTMPAGEHDFYVVVDRAGSEVSTAATVEGPESVSVSTAPDEDDDGEEMMLYLGIVLLAVILLTVLVLLKKRS